MASHASARYTAIHRPHRHDAGLAERIHYNGFHTINITDVPLAEQFFGSAYRVDFALFEHHQIIGEAGGKIQIMNGHHRRNAPSL